MSNQKKLIILGLVSLFLISGLLLMNYLNSKKDVKNLDEIGQLMKDNEDIVKTAGNENSPFVRVIDETDHILGDINAPVQLIIYNDFECDFCAKFQETIKEVREFFGDKIVIAYRHFPLRSNPNSYNAALASECASEQGKFWEMHDKLFSDNEENKMYFEQFLINAENLELDTEKFETCYNAENGKQKIQSDLDEGKRVGVTGSPQTFVNGQALPGAYPFEDFVDSAQVQRKGMKSVIERELNNNQ